MKWRSGAKKIKVWISTIQAFAIVAQLLLLYANVYCNVIPTLLSCLGFVDVFLQAHGFFAFCCNFCKFVMCAMEPLLEKLFQKPLLLLSKVKDNKGTCFSTKGNNVCFCYYWSSETYSALFTFNSSCARDWLSFGSKLCNSTIKVEWLLHMKVEELCACIALLWHHNCNYENLH